MLITFNYDITMFYERMQQHSLSTARTYLSSSNQVYILVQLLKLPHTVIKVLHGHYKTKNMRKYLFAQNFQICLILLAVYISPIRDDQNRDFSNNKKTSYSRIS